MTDYEIHNAIFGTEVLYVRYEYRDPKQNSNKFWAIERTQTRGSLQVRWGRIGTHGTISNQGINPVEAVTRKNEKVAKGYSLSRSLSLIHTKTSKPKISEAFPGLPYGDIRGFRNDDAIDSERNVIMTFPPDVRETLTNTYELE